MDMEVSQKREEKLKSRIIFSLKRGGGGGGCNGNRKFSCFWCKMKDFFVSTKCNHFDKKIQPLSEILSFEKTTYFCGKKYFLTPGKATMT